MRPILIRGHLTNSTLYDRKGILRISPVIGWPTVLAVISSPAWSMFSLICLNNKAKKCFVLSITMVTKSTKITMFI